MCGASATEEDVNGNPLPKEKFKFPKDIKGIVTFIGSPSGIPIITVSLSIAAGIAGGIVVGVGSSKNKSEKTKKKSKRVGYALIATGGSIIATTAAFTTAALLLGKTG